MHKMRISLLFWIYCAVLVTFNEFIALFFPKGVMRIGYILLMMLFGMVTLYKQKYRIDVSRIDLLVTIYFMYVFLRGIFQHINGVAIVGTTTAWLQNSIPIFSYFIASDLNKREKKTVEILFALFSFISVTAGMLNIKLHFLPAVGTFAGKLYAYVGNNTVVVRGYSLAGIALITGFISGFSMCCLLDLDIGIKRKAVLFLVNFAGCLYSLSRGALAFVVIAMLSYLILRCLNGYYKVSKKKALCIILVTILVLIVVIVNLDKIINSAIFNRFIKIGLSQSEGSNNIRTEFQKKALSIILKAPIVGIGYGFTGYQAISAGIENTINTESYILSLGISSGLIGLLLFMLIAFFSILKSRKIEKNMKYIGAVIGMLAWSVMYILLDSDLIGLFYWYCIGALNERKHIK